MRAPPDQRNASRFALRRWQEYEGERRANLLRLLGIGAFYTVELINRRGLRLGVLEFPPVAGADDRFHYSITALAVAWTMLGLGVMLALRRPTYPGWLKYVATLGDLALLTALLVVADGPRSPLVVVFFLLIALAGLRLDLLLVRLATIGAVAAYLYLNGFARWFTEREIGVPRYHQLVVLIALALTGVVLGQIIRTVDTAMFRRERRGPGEETR